MSEWFSRKIQEFSTRDLKTSKFVQQDFHLRKSVIHGVPNNPRALAWDPIQELLAVGTESGHIVVYGKVHVERRFQLPDSPDILSLFFLVNEGFVVAIAADQRLYMCSLHPGEAIQAIDTGSGLVTAVCHIHGSPFVYLGYDHGMIAVFDLTKRVQTDYKITLRHVLGDDAPEKSTVVGVHVHPEDDSKILIGYFSGEIAVWDIKTRTVVRLCGQGIHAMNTLCWHKSGKNFASGYEKGEIIIWNAKNGEIQQRVLTLGGPKKIRRYPVRKLLWSTFNRDRSTLYAVGGTIMPDEPDGSVISIFGPQYQEYHFAHIGKVSDFLLTYNNPWPNGTDDPLSLIALPAEGGLQMYRILPLGFPPIQMPHAFTLHTSRIACIDYHTGISQQFIDDLREIIVETDRDRLKLIQEYWPMKHGGRTSSNITAHPAVIVTGHTDGFVRVWDASSVSLSLIGYFDAGKIISKKPTVPSITTVKLCPSSRTIVVAFLGGEVHVFAFRKVIPRSSHASSEVASEHLSPVLGEQSLAATALSAGPSTPVVSATSSPVDVKATVSIAPTIAARMNCAKIGGFYDTGIFVTHQARISSLALDTGIDRLCVGDQDGLLTITDLSSGICLLKCCLGEKPSTIHDLSVSHFAPTPTAKASSNTLLVSLDIGTLYGIDLHDCTILFNLKPTHISPVLSCYVVDENAQPVTIPPGKWSPVMEEEYLKEVQGPAHDSTADVHERAAESSSTEAPVTNVDVSTSAVAQPEAQAGGNPPSQDFGFEVIDMPEGQATVNPSLVNPQPEVPVTQSPDANETTSPPIESQTPSQEGQAAQPDKDHSQDPVPKPVPSVSETGTADSLPGGASATDRKAAQKDLEKRQSNRESKGYSLQTLFKFGRDKKQDDRKKEEEIKDDHASTNQAKSGVTSPHPTHPNCYVVQVCRNFIRMFLFPAQTRLFKIPVKDEINFSQLINWNGDVCLFTYDSANLIQIYALLDLRVIASFDASDDGGMFESDMKFRTAINSDGRIIASLDGTQLSRYSLIVDENELNLPASLPSVFTPSRLTPARPPVAGFFKTLFGTNQATDLQELFKTSGGSVRANSVPRTAQEDPESDPTEQTIHQEAQSTAAVVAETVNLLHQRGERLANLQNSVATLEEQSLNFLTTIQEYNRQQRAKSWWEL